MTALDGIAYGLALAALGASFPVVRRALRVERELRIDLATLLVRMRLQAPGSIAALRRERLGAGVRL